MPKEWQKDLKPWVQRITKKDFKLITHYHVVNLPLQWRKPQVIFVNSMSDLFHKNVSLDFILKVFETMNKAHWHVFQVLTKRSDRLLELNKYLPWSKNIWMGVSIENQDYTFRIKDLSKTDAAIKFLSIEPLIGPVYRYSLNNIDWVIVGGESGPKARPMKEEWVVSIRNKCLKQNVPFFFKQWGGVQKKRNGRELEGRTWDEMPQNVYQVI